MALDNEIRDRFRFVPDGSYTDRAALPKPRRHAAIRRAADGQICDGCYQQRATNGSCDNCDVPPTGPAPDALTVALNRLAVGPRRLSR